MMKAKICQIAFGKRREKRKEKKRKEKEKEKEP